MHFIIGHIAKSIVKIWVRIECPTNVSPDTILAPFYTEFLRFQHVSTGAIDQFPLSIRLVLVPIALSSVVCLNVHRQSLCASSGVFRPIIFCQFCLVRMHYGRDLMIVSESIPMS